MEWDTLLWNAEVTEEENEIRLSIEGTCNDIDEETCRQLKRDGSEVKKIKIGPKRAQTKASQPL